MISPHINGLLFRNKQPIHKVQYWLDAVAHYHKMLNWKILSQKFEEIIYGHKVGCLGKIYRN